MNNALMFLATSSGEKLEEKLNDAVKPIVDLINAAFGPAMAIVGALGAVFCISLGVKFAKAEEPQDREKAKHGLRNAIIGFALIFILLIALKVFLPILMGYAEGVTTSSGTST